MNEVLVKIKLDKCLDKVTGKKYNEKTILSIENKNKLAEDIIRSYIYNYVVYHFIDSSIIPPVKLFFNGGRIFKKISNKAFAVLDEKLNEYKISLDTLQVLFPDLDISTPTFTIKFKIDVEFHYNDKELDEYWEGSFNNFAKRLVEDKNFESACLNKNGNQLKIANLKNEQEKVEKRNHLENCFKI